MYYNGPVLVLVPLLWVGSGNEIITHPSAGDNNDYVMDLYDVNQSSNKMYNAIVLIHISLISEIFLIMYITAFSFE